MALEKAAEHLSNAILGELHENGIDGGVEDFNGRLNTEEKLLASQKARDLAVALRQARTYMQHMKQQAISDIQNQLGDRIPNRIELIDVDGGAEAIRNIPARQVAAPVVPATHAG